MKRQKFRFFKPVRGRRRTTDQVLEFRAIVRPASAIEELQGLKLCFVQRSFGHTRPQVQVLKPSRRELLDRPGHELHTEISFRSSQIIEGIVIIGDPRRFQIEEHRPQLGV